MPNDVEIEGPDGNTYQFPEGTDKVAAIKYFKAKGIGTVTKNTAPAKNVPDSITRGAGPTYKGMVHGMATTYPVEITRAETKSYPIIGGAVGGMTGGVPGALLGGATGKAIEHGVERTTGMSPAESTPRLLGDIGWEGIKQGLYELGGRAIAAVGGRVIGRILGHKPPVPGEVIAGVKVPETAGQIYGKPGGFTQTVEHYLHGTFLGGALKQTRQAQEEAFRQIMAKLSKVPGADPILLSQNWAMAREITRGMADPIYNGLKEGSADEAGKVASSILEDESLKRALGGKAKDALTKLASDPRDLIAQGLGYKSAKEATGKMGESAFRQYADRVTAETGITHEVTIGDALQARHEIGDLASHAKDPADRRALMSAWEQLDSAIDKGLTPQEQALKHTADRMWRQSYIMDKISRNLERMSAAHDPREAAVLAVDSFSKMVNNLTRGRITRVNGRIVRKPAEIEILFPNKADQQAMIDLSSFLSSKYSTLKGKAGLSESIARIGVAMEALSIPGSAIMGHPLVAAHASAALVGTYALANVLAKPGGAMLTADFFRSTGAVQAALATRIVGEAMSENWEPQTKSKAGAAVGVPPEIVPPEKVGEWTEMRQ